jgi:carbonic anhydrase
MKNKGVKLSGYWVTAVILAVSSIFALTAASAEEERDADTAWKEGLALLKEGNARFTSGTRTYPDQSAERRQDTAKNGQHPTAVVLTCSDSRVPAEHLFDAGLGDIFVIRVAGNVADTDEIATVEYGVEHLKAPLVVVLGHTKCGAVTAVVKGDKVGGNLPKLVDNIVPAAERAKKAKGGDFSEALLAAAIEENVWQSLEDLLTKSPIVPEMARKGEIRLLGALYDIESGVVHWLGEHPRQKELLAREFTGEPAAVLNPPAASPGPALPVTAGVVFVGLLAAVYLALFARRTRVKKLSAQKRLAVAVAVVILVLSVALVLSAAYAPWMSGTMLAVTIVCGAATVTGVALFAWAVVRSTNIAFKEYIGYIRKNGS